MDVPTPEPGLVISYAYLWHDEYSSGLEEGLKARPAVIVLTVDRESDEATIVVVLPITHTPPSDKGMAVELPLSVKQHLKLDEQRSWIVVTEGNEFVWRGYDLRKRPRSNRCDYGFLPPKLFDAVREAFLAWHRGRKVRKAPR
jgi:uncharacterized protein YifN (PemK superfamily)